MNIKASHETSQHSYHLTFYRQAQSNLCINKPGPIRRVQYLQDSQKSHPNYWVKSYLPPLLPFLLLFLSSKQRKKTLSAIQFSFSFLISKKFKHTSGMFIQVLLILSIKISNFSFLAIKVGNCWWEFTYQINKEVITALYKFLSSFDWSTLLIEPICFKYR